MKPKPKPKPRPSPPEPSTAAKNVQVSLPPVGPAAESSSPPNEPSDDIKVAARPDDQGQAVPRPPARPAAIHESIPETVEEATQEEAKALGGEPEEQAQQPPQEAQEEPTEQPARPLRNLKSWEITADPDADATLVWTAQQKDDWLTAKAMGRRGHREMAEGIRMAMTSDPPLWHQEYRTSSDYAWGEYGHSRPWLTQELNWLRRQELLDELCKARGLQEMPISKEEGEHLAELEPHPDQFVRAMVESEIAYRSRGKSKKSKATFMKGQVARQRAYLREHKIVRPDLAWEEFESLERLGDDLRGYGSTQVEDLVKEPDPAKRREMLVAACRAQRSLPPNEQIAQVARGRDLYALVEDLLTLKKEWEKDKELAEARALVARLEKEQEAKAAEGARRPANDIAQAGAQTVAAEEPKAEYEYELELTGDLMGLIKDTKLFAADQVALAVGDLARQMAEHPITKDSSLHIKVRQK
jgi:hypothetical protein